MMRRIGLVLLAGVMLAGCRSPGLPGMGEAEETITPGLASEELKGFFDGNLRRRALEAEYQALQFGPTGAPVSWEGGSRRGSVIPGPVYQIGSRDCRDYTHTFYVNEKATVKKGTACRQGEESEWQLTM